MLHRRTLSAMLTRCISLGRFLLSLRSSQWPWPSSVAATRTRTNRRSCGLCPRTGNFGLKGKQTRLISMHKPAPHSVRHQRTVPTALSVCSSTDASSHKCRHRAVARHCRRLAGDPLPQASRREREACRQIRAATRRTPDASRAVRRGAKRHHPSAEIEIGRPASVTVPSIRGRVPRGPAAATVRTPRRGDIAA